MSPAHNFSLSVELASPPKPNFAPNWHALLPGKCVWEAAGANLVMEMSESIAVELGLSRCPCVSATKHSISANKEVCIYAASGGWQVRDENRKGVIRIFIGEERRKTKLAAAAVRRGRQLNAFRCQTAQLASKLMTPFCNIVRESKWTRRDWVRRMKRWSSAFRGWHRSFFFSLNFSFRDNSKSKLFGASSITEIRLFLVFSSSQRQFVKWLLCKAIICFSFCSWTLDSGTRKSGRIC